MPNKLTDAEIKKALESEINRAEYVGTDYLDCVEVKDFKLALDLINRYEEENNELQLKIASCNAEIERLEKALENQQKISMDRHFEIERLKNHIQEGIDLAKQIPEMLALAKAEAYKECIEKAKSELKNVSKFDFHGTYYYLVGEAFFDNLLNELVGDEDAK